MGLKIMVHSNKYTEIQATDGALQRGNMNENDNQEQNVIFVPSLEEGPTYRVLWDVMNFPLRSAQTQGAFLLCFNQVSVGGQVGIDLDPLWWKSESLG